MEKNTEYHPADEHKIYPVFEKTSVYALFQVYPLLGDREEQVRGLGRKTDDYP